MGRRRFNVFCWVSASVTHAGPWKLNCKENSVTSASGQRGESVCKSPVQSNLNPQFGFVFMCFLKICLCLLSSDFLTLIFIIITTLFYPHFFLFSALLWGAGGAFIISICWLIFMHVSAPSLLCFDWLSRVKNAKTHLNLAARVEGRSVTIPPHCCYLHKLTRLGQDLVSWMSWWFLKNPNLISSPVRLGCSSALICMNMYKHLFLTFKGLTAESVTCFRIAVGGVFSALLRVELFIIIIIMCWGAQHTELMSILKAKLA